MVQSLHRKAWTWRKNFEIKVFQENEFPVFTEIQISSINSASGFVKRMNSSSENYPDEV